MAKHNTRSSVNDENGDTSSDPIPNPEIHSTPTPQANTETRDRPAHEDPSSPYFLSTGDHPGLLLVSTLLTGSNFQSWRRAITMAFAAKNKTAFLDGSLPKPDPTDLSFCAWTRCNNMVMSWLLHSVSPQIAQSIMFFNLASDMWNDLVDRFNEGNGPRIFQLKAELHSLQQGD
ncbi:uncharacterized protein LOC133031234 [Cannabis sativa]|uniref:uncharacterized protein LOC133031234 n=1 Tax=Cannabis sativa TaxID=3483 RepID=UPI0029CA39A5|nr:uncharacterized protein LOC133031234 [Cannabis sativa]